MCIHVPIHVDLDANKNDDDDDEDGALIFTYFVVSSCFVIPSRLRCRTPRSTAEWTDSHKMPYQPT